MLARRHPNLIVVTVIITSMTCIASKAVAQDDHVSTEVDASYEFIKVSWSYAQDALEQINKCTEIKTVNELEPYILRAEFLVDLARIYADKAESEADDAESEASGIDCFGAEEESNRAGGHFKKAEDKFENAFAELTLALSDSDSNYKRDLEKAIASINHAMTDIEIGTDELENTLSELDDCN